MQRQTGFHRRSLGCRRTIKFTQTRIPNRCPSRSRIYPHPAKQLTSGRWGRLEYLPILVKFSIPVPRKPAEPGGGFPESADRRGANRSSTGDRRAADHSRDEFGELLLP